MDELDIYAYERSLAGEGVIFCGVDEAGRGPLAGPVCAAAVILSPETRIEGLDDSKKLSGKKREELYDILCERAVSFGVALNAVEGVAATEQSASDIAAWCSGSISYLTAFETVLKRYGFPT